MLRRRQGLVALLFAATAISYVDRQTLSVVAPRLRDELNISNFDYARIVFAFLLAYTIMQPVTGWLMDRLGSRRGFTIIMAWWSAATIFHAFGQGVASFSLLRFLLGVGQAGSWAVSVRAVAEWFPPHARGGPNGIWGAGTSVGSIVAIPLVAWLTVAFGWRAAFVVSGLAGFVWVAAWLTIYQVPAGSAMPSSGGDVDAGRSIDRSTAWPLLHLLRERSLWALVLARLFADPIVWFYNAWVPEYLARSAGFSMTEVGWYGWIPFFANGLGIVLGGAASDWLCRRHWPVIRARVTVMGVGALVLTAGVIAALPVPVSVALTAISLAVFGFGLWAPNMMSLGADAFPPGNAGSVTGLSGMGAGIGGMAYTLFTGWMLDRFGYAPVFVTSGIAPLIAFAILYTLLDRRPVLLPPPPATA